VTPALQGPDEDAHFAYTQQLVERHRLPASTGAGSPLSTEMVVASTWADLSPTRGNISSRTAWSATEQAHWQVAARALSAPQRGDGTGLNPAAENPPLYYVYEAVPYWLGLHASGSSFFTRLELMRLANAPLYLATILFVWLLTREVLGRRWSATIAASAVALVPEFGFLSATVNPDVALAAEWSGFAYFAVRIVKEGPGLVRTLALVLCAAAALFTQPRSLALFPIALIVLALAPKPSTRERASAALAALTIGVSTYGSFAFVRDHALPGSVARSGSAFHVTQFLAYLWQFYLPRLPGMPPMIGPHYGAAVAWVDRFFGDLGWLEIAFPLWANTALRAATVALLAALVVGLLLRRSAVRRSWRVAVALVSIVLLELLTLHVAAYESLVVNPGDPILTGRYLFPLISIWGLAVATALDLLPKRLAAPLVVGVVGAAAALDLFAFALALERFYA
jgi:hypothetical protein